MRNRWGVIGLVAIIAESGLTKHTDVVAMLKQRHGMSHGSAHRVSLIARGRSKQPEAEPATRLSPNLQSVYARLLDKVIALGDDVEQAPKRG